jgi:hypothetical protein
MGEELKTWKRYQPREDKPELSREERRALHKLRMEAKRAGASLSSAGRGGLSPSLVLTIFRRDKYRCKVCGGDGKESGGLQLHHKGNVENPASRWLAQKGRSNDPNNITTICASCHDNIHDEDRAKGEPDE